jgi:hypothetical protein
VLVGEEWRVDVPEDLPALQGVGQLRIEVVGERGHRDVHLAALTRGATTAIAVVVTAAGSQSERRQDNDRSDRGKLPQIPHANSLL